MENSKEDNIRTDALPEHLCNNSKTKENKETDSLNHKGSSSEKEFNKFPNLSSSKTKSSQKHRVKTKNPKSSQNFIQLNISNTSNVHIGAKNTIVINKGEENKSSGSKIEKTKSVEDLMMSKEAMTQDTILYISSHIGKNWRTVGRKIDLSDGQIEQIYEQYYPAGLKEVIYQILLDWIRNKPKSASIGAFAEILWDCNEKDAVLRLNNYVKDQA